MRFSRCLVGTSILGLLIAASFLTQPVAPQKRTFHVCYINTMQKEVLQGKTVIVIFGASYSSANYAYYAYYGEPCELKPRAGQTQPTGSFEVKGSRAILVTDIPVTPTGNLGEYRAELNLPVDFPVEKAAVFAVKDSFYDGETTGPDRDSSYIETPDPLDDSTFMLVGSAHSVVAFFGFNPGGFATLTGLFILSIFLAVLLVFLLQRTGKKSRDSGSFRRNQV